MTHELKAFLDDVQQDLSKPLATAKVGILNLVAGAARAMVFNPKYTVLSANCEWLDKFIPDLLLDAFSEAMVLEGIDIGEDSDDED